MKTHQYQTEEQNVLGRREATKVAICPPERANQELQGGNGVSKGVRRVRKKKS